MNRIIKDKGLVEYDNQASILKIKESGEYTDVYPKELDTGVTYNKNTLTYNDRHIELNGDTVAEAFENLKERIATTGRTFNACNIDIADDYKIKKVLEHKGVYYVLCVWEHDYSKVYYSNDLVSWNVVNTPKQYVDMTVFSGDIYATYTEYYEPYISGVPGITRDNYITYVKSVPDRYGYNKGDELCCDNEYIPYEEFFYNDGTDHWNVGLVYDEKLVPFNKETYLSHVKTIPDEYGYNKGDDFCVRDEDYLEGEEFFYNDGTDHWNVALVYTASMVPRRLRIDKVDFINNKYEECFADSTLTYRYDSDILMGSDKSSILVFTKHDEGYAFITGRFILANDQWILRWNINGVADTGLPSSTVFPYNKIVNSGNGLYYIYYNKLRWIIKNNDVFGKTISSMGISNYDPSKNEIYANSNDNITNYYDLMNIEGRYIGNQYDTRTGKPACFYDNISIISSTHAKKVLDQPLMRLTHTGSYVFGVGYNDGKLYYSQVK